MNKKTLLIIGGGIETVKGVEIAHSMGLHVVVSDQNPNAPCFKVADDKIIASTYNVTDTLVKAKEYNDTVRHIDGVISIGSDIPLTVAQVASSLGLPHIPLHTAKICSHKLMMKNELRHGNVRVPAYWLPHSEYDIPGVNLGKNTYDLSLQYVVKPVDSRGARGVIRIRDGNWFWAYQEAIKYSTMGQVLVEEWLDGPQVSTEGIVVKGKYYHVATVDRNYSRLDEFAPYVIEDGGNQPSYLDQPGQEAIRSELLHQLQRATTAIGLDNGTLKGDIVIHNHMPYIIEVAPRLSGGHLSTIQIPLATGIHIVKEAISIALGEYKSYRDDVCMSAVAIRYVFPKPGTYSEMSWCVQDVPFVDDNMHTQWFIKAGDTVKSPENHPGRVGCVICTGKDAQEAIQRAEWMVEHANLVRKI